MRPLSKLRAFTTSSAEFGLPARLGASEAPLSDSGSALRRRLRPEDEETLLRLRDRLLLTIDFIANVEEFPMATRIRRHAIDAAKEKTLREMRQIVRDIDKLTVALPQDVREGLGALLLHRLGVDKEAERTALGRRVAVAIRRCTVDSERERRHLEEYLEMLEAMGGAPAEIKAVRDLLRRG